MQNLKKTIIGITENRLAVFILSLLMIILISYFDFVTGPDLSFSLFYLIPISLFAIYRNTTYVYVLMCTVFASALGFIAEYVGRGNSDLFLTIWNSVVRFSTFAPMGLLLVYLKEKLAELRQTNNNLKKLNDEKNILLGTAAHDLRNPIGGIYSFSKLLINDFSDQLNTEAQEIVEIIKSTSHNSLYILQNLLDVSKIESGQVALNLKNQDYISFLQQQITLNRILAKHKEISISFHYPAGSLILRFDEHYLSEVVDNLLSNAIKYSNRNTNITVKVSLAGNQQVLTEVIDQGQGIPEGEQQKLFNYFQKSSIRPTGGEHSTGLGLAIARKIVVLHEGEIGLKSVPKEGSDFYFLLPVTLS